jgi:hypothetical protein
MLGLALMALLVVALMTWGWGQDGDAWIRHDLGDASPTPIGRLAAGPVRVTGRVRRAEELLDSPVTGTPCVAFLVSLLSHGKTPTRERLTYARPFLVEDETGSVLVDPGTSYAAALAPGKQYSVTALNLPPRRRADLWQAFQIPSHHRYSWFFDDLNFWREDLLVEGRIVSVAGYAMEDVHASGESAGPRQLPTRLVIRAGGPHEPLLLADHFSPRPGSGMTSP